MKKELNGRAWSVELEGTGYADDTYVADTYEECVEYLKKNYSDYEDDYQIAEIELVNGCVDYTYDIVKKEDIE